MPGVTVIARNTETGVERRTLTNDLGFYQVPFLPLRSSVRFISYILMYR